MFLQQCNGILLMHDVDAVTDALGLAKFDGPVNVAAEAFVGDEAGSEFAGVHGDVHFGIERVEIVEHGHLLFEIGHGFAAVFGHDEVDADDALGIRGDGFESEQGLREDLLLRKSRAGPDR